MIYIYIILLFHWIIAYCKTTKRIGMLNFTNMNLPFVVINLLIVCLSIAGRTTQGYTGDALHDLFGIMGHPSSMRHLHIDHSANIVLQLALVSSPLHRKIQLGASAHRQDP